MKGSTLLRQEATLHLLTDRNDIGGSAARIRDVVFHDFEGVD
ncbi:MAG: hypothetical protein PHU03_06525 [Syntrophales bacterium]|nr:hypothetical protein [Syntrophales bacterium]